MDQPDRGYFAFDVKKDLVYRALVEKGCVGDVVRPVPLDADGLLPLNIHTFDIDTFILEDSQIKRVDLLDVEKRPYLSLTFTAPEVGLWSPPTRNAPFVCIEPWYGRCDRAHYTGGLGMAFGTGRALRCLLYDRDSGGLIASLIFAVGRRR